MNNIEIDNSLINFRKVESKRKYKSTTPDINYIISRIDEYEDIVAWQTKRKLNPSKEHKLINNKLYDLKKKKFLRMKTSPIKEEIETLKSLIKERRINKPRNKSLSTKTDKDYYTPLIHNFLSGNKGKAYTYDSIAKGINYNIIDKDDKKYFIDELLKKLNQNIKVKKYEGSTYYYKL